MGEGSGDKASPTSLEIQAHQIAATITDPEIPVLTIADLGILRSVEERDGTVHVAITPTYSGCPAMNMIQFELELALARADIPARVHLVLSPAWTTDWLTETGRDKLRAYGVAPPSRAAGRRALFSAEDAACPRCGSADTECIAEYGSTSCKSLRRCRACREPFDQFKCH